MGILSKHIPHKIIICNDKDAPWITPKLKTAIRRNSRVYRKWVKRGKHKNDFDQIRIVQNTTNKLIREAKQLYYEKSGEKLSDPPPPPPQKLPINSSGMNLKLLQTRKSIRT